MHTCNSDKCDPSKNVPFRSDTRLPQTRSFCFLIETLLLHDHRNPSSEELWIDHFMVFPQSGQLLSLVKRPHLINCSNICYLFLHNSCNCNIVITIFSYVPFIPTLYLYSGKIAQRNILLYITLWYF